MGRFQKTGEGVGALGIEGEPAGAISGFQSLGWEDPRLGVPVPRGVRRDRLGSYLVGGHLSLDVVDRGTNGEDRISGQIDPSQAAAQTVIDAFSSGGEAAQA